MLESEFVWPGRITVLRRTTFCRGAVLGNELEGGDENIPLCFEHHRELHERGNEGMFFKKN